MFTLAQAEAHPAWDDALRNAIDRAARDRDTSISLYYDGEAVYVRAEPAAPPPNATRVMVAQYWSTHETNGTVSIQLRSAGAKSEWVTR